MTCAISRPMYTLPIPSGVARTVVYCSCEKAGAESERNTAPNSARNEFRFRSVSSLTCSRKKILENFDQRGRGNRTSTRGAPILNNIDLFRQVIERGFNKGDLSV